MHNRLCKLNRIIRLKVVRVMGLADSRGIILLPLKGGMIRKIRILGCRKLK